MKRQLFIAALLLGACSNQGPNANRNDQNIEGENDLPFNPSREPFNDSTKSGLGGAMASGQGGLTATDQMAFQKLFNETDNVNTFDELAKLSDSILAELTQIQTEERRTGIVNAGRRIGLMQSALTDCVQRVAAGAPQPGQPLQGRWEGNGCAVQAKSSKKGQYQAGPLNAFAIAGIASPNRFPVSGVTSGLMGAKADGVGVVSATPWAGELSDESLRGVVNHPKYQKVGGREYPCSMEVGLRASTNPIPENYVLAMKVLGKCYKQAIFLASPAMDSLFKKMDPALVQLLQNRMLGIGGGGR